MADRLTQLQEAVNQLGDYFCNSVGVLQQDTGPEQAQQTDSKDPAASQEDNAALFSNLISRTAQDIDLLIDSLPSQEYTPEKQVETLKRLEAENKQSAERLAQAVEEGEALLVAIRQALQQIAEEQLGIEPEPQKR